MYVSNEHTSIGSNRQTYPFVFHVSIIINKLSRKRDKYFFNFFPPLHQLDVSKIYVYILLHTITLGTRFFYFVRTLNYFIIIIITPKSVRLMTA